MQDSKIMSYISTMFARWPKMKGNGYLPPSVDLSRLTSQSSIGGGNDASSLIDPPQIYYGTIASGNQVMAESNMRDYIRKGCGARCVEMEAAGLMDYFKYIVIRGICDFADLQKNDLWQKYAAVTAAAFAKELLLYVSPAENRNTDTIQQAVGKFH